MARTIRTISKDDRAEWAMSADHLAAVQGLRRSSAASKHDSRPRRQRTRAAARRFAVKEAS